MGLIPVLCPHCQSDQVIKGGQTETGKQHYRCQQTDCSHHSFVLDPAYNGRLPYIKEQKRTNYRHGAEWQWQPRYPQGAQDQPHDRHQRAEKKESIPSHVKHRLLAWLEPAQVEVVIGLAEAAEGDAMWAYVGKKKEQCWLWHAIAHGTGKVLAYVFGGAKMTCL